MTHHHKNPTKKLNNITFGEIISKNSYYGVVWGGIYKGKKNCVIKMVRIANGLTDEKYFQKNDQTPFKHKLFSDKTAMTLEMFINEVNKQKTLYGFRLAPKIYSFWVDTTSSHFHYGFIVMKRLNCTMKDILLKRDLTSHEDEMVTTFINTLHTNYKTAHRDLKPANIGVFLNPSGLIDKCLFLDCCNVKFKSDVSDDQFYKYVMHDWEKFKLHKQKNIQQRIFKDEDFDKS